MEQIRADYSRQIQSRVQVQTGTIRANVDGTEVGFTRERTILMDLAQTVRRTNAEMFDVILCLCK